MVYGEVCLSVCRTMYEHWGFQDFIVGGRGQLKAESTNGGCAVCCRPIQPIRGGGGGGVCCLLSRPIQPGGVVKKYLTDLYIMHS